MPKAAIHNPYWDSLGGGERYAAAVARMLLKRGWPVDIWWNSNLSPKIKARFDIDISGATFTPQTKFSDYDLVFWVSDGSIPTSTAKKTLIHFQVPFHDSKSSSFANRMKLKFYTVVCNSHFTKSVIDKTYGIDSQVVYPPVEVERFKPGVKANQIVSLARFSQTLHSKRQDILIKAFSKLGLMGWKLIFAGGVNDIDYLSELKLKSQGLNVEYITDPSIPKIRELMATSKIFWSATGFGVDQNKFPEKVEHFGITPVEAMAAGCVPIVTALGGHLETVIPGESGYLWTSIDQLLTHTRLLANDVKLWEKLSKQGISRSKLFSTQVFEEKMSQLI